MSKPPLTEQESVVMRSLVDAWNGFLEIEPTHPDHVEQFRRGIHECQNVLMHRVVQRDYPKDFPKR